MRTCTRFPCPLHVALGGETVCVRKTTPRCKMRAGSFLRREEEEEEPKHPDGQNDGHNNSWRKKKKG